MVNAVGRVRNDYYSFPFSARAIGEFLDHHHENLVSFLGPRECVFFRQGFSTLVLAHTQPQTIHQPYHCSVPASL